MEWNRVQKQQEAVEELSVILRENTMDCEAFLTGQTEELLWRILCLFQEEPFYTAKGLEYTYHIRGNEMFVDRKDKSITRASVAVAAENAVRIQRKGESVSGPKKLGTFGASYLYPVFIRIGLITVTGNDQ